MLAAERRGELGIARAIGTRRGHLTEMFTFEGAAYDLVAAAVGAILGGWSPSGWSTRWPRQARRDEDAGLQISSRSRGRASHRFALGVLLTLVVVAFSAWRVSTMTIATAIRNLPEPPSRPPAPQGRARRGRPPVRRPAHGHGRERGDAPDARVSLAVVSLVPFARLVGIPDRIAYTGAGLAMSSC